MIVLVLCPRCSQALTFDDDAVGYVSRRCPACGMQVRVCFDSAPTVAKPDYDVRLRSEEEVEAAALW